MNPASSRSASPKILISAQDINKHFKVGERNVTGVSHANFTIADGSFTIIYGPSGSGKTTLLNTLTGLDQPTEGTVLYEGGDIYGMTEAELAHFRARTMGIVHQTSYWVKSLTVLENVALPLYFLGYDRANAEREAMESLRRVGLDRYADTLPPLLSGGEQQRISMARALVSNPSYIVADEPTGNLDSENGDKIMQLLNYFHKEFRRTIILVTHNEKYLRYATQTLYMKDGVVTEPSAKPQTTPIASTFKPIQSTDAIKPIRFTTLLRISLANLKAKKFRNNLTMLGVAIGVSTVFMLLSFGLGMQSLVQKEIIGTDSVRVINVTSVNSDIINLDAEAAKKIGQLSNIEKIGKQYTSAAEFQLGSAKADAVVYGIDQDYLTLNNFDISSGSPVQPSQLDQVMVSQSLITTLGYGDTSTVVGEKINLSLKLDTGEGTVNRPLTITGVVDAGSGSAMYVPANVFEGLGVKNYSQIKVVADNDSNAVSLRQEIENMGYQTSSPLDTIDQVNRFFNFFNLILVGFGGIGMLIATIGMLNTLTVALLERTKEVGLMIALGARRRDMKRLFTTEALLLTSIGGAVGIVVSVIVRIIIDAVSNHFAAARGVDESFSLFATPFWLVLAVLAFICLVGYLVSVIPARRASKIAPVDALRRE